MMYTAAQNPCENSAQTVSCWSLYFHPFSLATFVNAWAHWNFMQRKINTLLCLSTQALTQLTVCVLDCLCTHTCNIPSIFIYHISKTEGGRRYKHMAWHISSFTCASSRISFRNSPCSAHWPEATQGNLFTPTDNIYTCPGAIIWGMSNWCNLNFKSLLLPRLATKFHLYQGNLDSSMQAKYL